MTNNNEKIYFQALVKATEKILSKLTDKIKSIEEKIDSLKNIKELPEFQEVVLELKTLSQDVSNLRILDEKEKENLTIQISYIQKKLSEFNEKLYQNERSAANVKELLNNSLKKILEELEKIKEKISKYEKEIRFFREGLLKSPGITGPSASGVEILLNDTKKGVYSKLNFIEGINVTLDFSEDKREGRADLTINSAGGGSSTDAIIYSIALG
jgi:DNA-directed RNA polymerase subunit L